MTRMPTLTSSIQHSIGSPSHSIQTRKRNKMYPNWKGRGKIVTICPSTLEAEKTLGNIEPEKLPP